MFFTEQQNNIKINFLVFVTKHYSHTPTCLCFGSQVLHFKKTTTKNMYEDL